jgi:hypothetical protein
MFRSIAISLVSFAATALLIIGSSSPGPGFIA